MIKPDRHTNPDFSVINLSAFILGQLSPFYPVSYDRLMEATIDKFGLNGKENYPYALNLLFLLGKLAYEGESDTFTLTNEN